MIFLKFNFLKVTGNTPLMYAAMENKLVLVRKMIQLGCEVNAVNKEGYSSLHLGAMYAREPLVALLLSNGANVSITGGVRSFLFFHNLTYIYSLECGKFNLKIG